MVTETKVKHCPFSKQTLPCNRVVCGDCEVRIKATARENQQIAENMKSYWAHLADGAER